MSSILIRDVMILALDAQNKLIERGHIFISDSKIQSIGVGDFNGDQQPTRIIEGRGRLAVPGLVNAHTHSQSSTMSGFADRLSHPAFMWLTQAHTSNRTPDEIRLAVQLCAYGMMTSGTTAAIDHFPGQRFTASDMDAVLSAWEETGMRIGLAMRFFDSDFADIFPAVPLPDDVQQRMAAAEVLKPQALDELGPLMDDVITRWHGRAGRVSVMPAPSNPDRCTNKALLLCAELAQRHDTGIHTHLLETQKQARLALEMYGETSVAHLETLGILSDRWSCAHSIWLSDDDMNLMAKRGAVAVLNPESNARLGTGRARVPMMREAGMRLALGTDGSGANDNQVLHEAMRAVATEHRAHAAHRADWISAAEVLSMATQGGAHALRQHDIGRLEVGCRADLVLYRLDAPWWIPINSPAEQLVFSETGASVESVIIDGKPVVENSRVMTFDVEAMAREVRAMVMSLRRRNEDLFAVADAIAGLVP